MIDPSITLPAESDAAAYEAAAEAHRRIKDRARLALNTLLDQPLTTAYDPAGVPEDVWADASRGLPDNDEDRAQLHAAIDALHDLIDTAENLAWEYERTANLARIPADERGTAALALQNID